MIAPAHSAPAGISTLARWCAGKPGRRTLHRPRKATPMPRANQPPAWLHSDRFLARRLARPVQRFMHIEAAGGIVLLAATVIALVWANSPWSGSYDDLWTTELTFDLGGRVV